MESGGLRARRGLRLESGADDRGRGARADRTMEREQAQRAKAAVGGDFGLPSELRGAETLVVMRGGEQLACEDRGRADYGERPPQIDRA